MKNLLILCGGQSPEHSISIRSTKNILGAIDQSKYRITLVGITRDGEWRLLNQDELGEEIKTKGVSVSIHPGKRNCLEADGRIMDAFDVAFPILHGPYGEDGTIQGLLTLLGVPFVGPGVIGSAVSMDKDTAKRLLRDIGLKVADWLLIRNGEKILSYGEVKDKLGKVVFVKPANMGSSVGVHRVTNQKEWIEAIEDALKYDNKILVEKNIDGKELECAVLGNTNPQASGVGEVQSGHFYSYEEKYHVSSQAGIIIPAKIESKHLSSLRSTAIKAYETLNCEGMSRVDMFLTESGDIYVNEVNTIPGFTSISMYPKLWEQEGISYSDLIDKLIELAIDRGIR